MSDKIPVTITMSRENCAELGNLSDAEAEKKMFNSIAGSSNNDSKPRGRITSYAYFIQYCRQEQKKNYPGETVGFSEFNRNCAERWKVLTDEEKKRFQEMSEDDKIRYDLEMLNYVPTKEEGKPEKGKGKKLGKRPVKDPYAPKRPLTAFFWFCNVNRSRIKESNSELGFGEVAKLLGRLWSELSPENKSKYEAYAKQDKDRYDYEMAVYTTLAIAVSAPQNYFYDEDENEDDDE